MKTSLLSFILCMAALQLQAQANYYRFSQSYAPYVPLSGDTVATPSDWANGIEYTNAMAGTACSFFGKTFRFNDTTVRLSYTSDGNLIVQDDTSQFVFSVLETSYDSIDAQTVISFRQTSGTDGDVLALQWNNVKLKNGPAGNFANFQLFFNLSTGAAEFHYGPSSANNASGYAMTFGPRAGLAYFNKKTAMSYERIVLSGQPSAIPMDTTKTTVLVDSAINATAFSLTGVPPSGTVYRFTPQQKPTGIPGSALPAGIRIIPNPFQQTFTIESVRPQDVFITDVCGRMFFAETLHAQQVIDGSSWPAGLYLIRFSDGSVKKLLKQ